VNCCAATLTGSNRATAGVRIAHGGPRLRTLARRGREAAGWIVPGSILALLPKCPACIVAYLAVGSGIGISVSTATYLHTGLVILCVGSLAYFAVRRGWRLMARLMGFPAPDSFDHDYRGAAMFAALGWPATLRLRRTFSALDSVDRIPEEYSHCRSASWNSSDLLD
jgi:hypothetical protein